MLIINKNLTLQLDIFIQKTIKKRTQNFQNSYILHIIRYKLQKKSCKKNVKKMVDYSKIKPLTLLRF